MKDKRYFQKVRPMENVDQTIGQYLAKPLRDEILKNRQAKLDRLKDGGEQTALRYHEPV